MKKFLYLSGTAFLSIVVCKSAVASGEIECPTGSSATTTCWPCGETCTAKFNCATGTMTFSGTGSIVQYAENTPWKNIAPRITSAVVEEGITSLPYSFLHSWYYNLSSLNSISLPNTLTKIGDAAFARLWNGNQVEGLVIPENITDWADNVFYMSHGNLYCPQSQIEHCTPQKHGNSTGMTVSGYENKDGMYYIYDSQGNVEQIYDSYNNFSSNVKKDVSERLSQKDENGNITVYNDNGQVAAQYSSSTKGLIRYAYGDDGSIAVYDEKGNLKKMQKRGPFTIEEADALTKKGNVNRFTITW